MNGRGDSLALAVVLLYGVAADGVMTALGPLGFAMVSLAVITGAVALHSLPEAKRKGPASHQPTKALRYKAH